MKVSRQMAFVGIVAGACALLVAVLLIQAPVSPASPPGLAPKVASAYPFDGERAYGYLKQIADIGPRASGTPGMQKQQALLEKHFTDLGGTVRWQKFQAVNPLTGGPVEMANLIVEWHPDRQERILLCAHYDTRPFPDRDAVNPRGKFVGANDGASGVAALMELAHSMPELDGELGVDMVLFDGEELVYTERDPYFHGSTHFAENYVRDREGPRYRWGVLLDMIGDAQLQIYQEGHSIQWPDTRPLVRDIWATARRLGVREFIARPGKEVRDDHLPLHDIGRISICNIIDFDYPHWHTTADTPDKCSAASLAKVGTVVGVWLKQTVDDGRIR